MPARNLILLLVATVGCLAAWFARHRDRHGRRIDEVLAIVDAAYIEPVDVERMVADAIDGAVSRLDGNSAYLRGDGQRELEAALDQQFGGVGLELAIDDGTGELAVSRPLPGGPAWQAGIRAGDRIRAIDGTTTAGLPLRDAVRMLRGKPGDPVTLAVAAASGAEADPAAAPTRDVRLVRETVLVESVEGDVRRPDGSWNYWLEGEPGVAFLRITGFGERTAAEFDAAVAQVAAGEPHVDGTTTPLRGIIIDVRGNPGGLVTAAVEVCDRLLDDGVIVSTRGRRRPAADAADDAPAADVRQATQGAVVAGVPIAVLVDGLTASAAEIVAACLQDHRRATIVGSRTYGKGTVQSIMPLSDGGLLKLTTAEYLRPAGATIQRRPGDAADADWGVSPDAGCAVSPPDDAVDRLARWRRHRAAGDVASGPGATPPREIDAVLARGLDTLPPAPSPPADLGGEKKTARDADDAMPPGV